MTVLSQWVNNVWKWASLCLTHSEGQSTWSKHSEECRTVRSHTAYMSLPLYFELECYIENNGGKFPIIAVTIILSHQILPICVFNSIRFQFLWYLLKLNRIFFLYFPQVILRCTITVEVRSQITSICMNAAQNHMIINSKITSSKWPSLTAL